MTVRQKAEQSIFEAITLLRDKPVESTMVERYFLLYEAWDLVRDLPQPLQMGRGIYHVLSKASLPVRDYDLLVGRYDDHVPTTEEQAKLNRLWKVDPNDNPIVVGNHGHKTLNWETVLRIGIPGYLSQVESRIQQAKEVGAGEGTLQFLEGLQWIYKGIILYMKRYGEAARNAGLFANAQDCENLAEGAPQTFREALQLLLFVYNVYLIYGGNNVACLTLGRLDDMLLPFYEKDLQAGILNEEEAGTLIDDFSAKLSLHLGRGEHQMSARDKGSVQTGWLRNSVYESPAYIMIGGYSNTTDHRTNPLTLLFARHVHPELKNPVYVCRHTADSNDEVWQVLCEKIQNNASLLLYNDETMIPAHSHIGVERRDAVNYSIHPCNWADIGGDHIDVGMCGRPLPILLNQALHAGKAFADMDEVYEVIKEAFTSIIRAPFNDYRKRFAAGKTQANSRLSLNDCFAENVIRAACGLSYGAARYPTLYVLLRNIGTAADMLSAVDTLVFRKKICSLEQLLQAAEGDFASAPDLLYHCRKAPKYGTNDALADGHAVRLMNTLLDIVDREATNENGQRDVYTLNVTINDSNHIWDGEAMPATVDGRRKGKPLSENLGPTVGYSKGITSLLNSVSKLPFDRIHSGALNVRLRRDLVEGKEGALRIKALVKSFFGQGGMQMQMTIADTEELKAAQAHPEEHRDLMVRITGYSAIFVDMSKEAQDEFITREELQ